MQRTLAILTLLAVAISVPASAAPVFFGGTVATYATVDDPIDLTFGSGGELYSGTDLTFSGGTDTAAAKIHRIGPGGAPVAEFGALTNADPDTVLFDGTGVISGGNPGAVLVGGRDGDEGYIRAILPDESQISIIGPGSGMVNPNSLLFDSTGRLVIADNIGQVYTYDGVNPAALLFSLPTRNGALAIDASDNIYTADIDGVVRIHDSLGNLVNGSFYTDATPAGISLALTFGPGSTYFGTDLFAIDRDSGDMYVLDSGGIATLVGTGWGSAGDIEFGPDGAMYVSLPAEDRVVRVVPEPSSVVLGLAAIGLAQILFRRRG